MEKILKNKFKIFLAIAAIITVPLLSGCGSSSSSDYLVDLEIWGPFDDSTVYAEIINQYKKLNPHVGEIKYRKFSQDTYKKELIDALASGQGPDIFLLNNSWVPYFENKIFPSPSGFVSEKDIKDNFPDVVYSDFVIDGKTYAVPLSVDSLQLYYNTDMFNAAGISYPPRTWEEFQEDVKKLTSIDSSGNIIRSGAAIGTAKNVNRFSDILSMLMFQNGLEMPLKKGAKAVFDESSIAPDGSSVQAGEKALGFYTQFSRLVLPDGTANPYYTWNLKQPNSVEAFASGSLGMMFNYSWQDAGIKSKNPKLNYSIASLPQAYASKPVTVANYWGYAVSLNKIIKAVDKSTGQEIQSAVTNEMRTHESWQFLKFLALKNSGTVRLYNAITKNSKDFVVNFDPAVDYLKKTQQPAARRDIIEMQKSDLILGPFAVGNLIAKHWYQPDSDAVDSIFLEMVDSVNNSRASLHEALLLAKNRTNLLLEK